MLKVLYVEDDAQSREVILMIERMNPGFMQTTMFSDSSHFEQRLLELTPPPDVILLDIHVKPLTGFQMLDIVRAHPQFSATPVVALTASVMNEEIDLLRVAGFHGGLGKPLNIDAFSTLLQRIVRGEIIWHV